MASSRYGRSVRLNPAFNDDSDDEGTTTRPAPQTTTSSRPPSRGLFPLFARSTSSQANRAPSNPTRPAPAAVTQAPQTILPKGKVAPSGRMIKGIGSVVKKGVDLVKKGGRKDESGSTQAIEGVHEGGGGPQQERREIQGGAGEVIALRDSENEEMATPSSASVASSMRDDGGDVEGNTQSENASITSSRLGGSSSVHQTSVASTEFQDDNGGRSDNETSTSYRIAGDSFEEVPSIADSSNVDSSVADSSREGTMAETEDENSTRQEDLAEEEEEGRKKKTGFERLGEKMKDLGKKTIKVVGSKLDKKKKGKGKEETDETAAAREASRAVELLLRSDSFTIPIVHIDFPKVEAPKKLGLKIAKRQADATGDTFPKPESSLWAQTGLRWLPKYSVKPTGLVDAAKAQIASFPSSEYTVDKNTKSGSTDLPLCAADLLLSETVRLPAKKGDAIRHIQLHMPVDKRKYACNNAQRGCTQRYTRKRDELIHRVYGKDLCKHNTEEENENYAIVKATQGYGTVIKGE